MDETNDRDASLREHLLYLLRGGGAHAGFDDVVKDYPVGLVGRRVGGVPYTPWQVLEHMRIAQWDILEFSRDVAHESPKWPEGYWSKDAGDAERWRETAEAFHKDLEAMCALVEDSANDLYARIPHGGGQTLLREALLVADHNAYHLGVLVALRRALEGRG
ncbi:MAG: DinB family protein [Acidobacteria bacterium]|nr:DinB family protein [Acidobacteriota bacterium]